MTALSAAATLRLSTLDIKYRWRFWLWIRAVNFFLGLDVLIVDARRTPASQNVLHRLNPKNPAYDPKNPSSHILGRAVDVNFHKNGQPVLLKASPASAWLPVVRLAAAVGIKWGGYFPGYADNNHFYV